MEAENYTQKFARGGKSWDQTTSFTGFAGTGAMISTPNTGTQVDTNYVTTTPELQYRIKFTTPGTYYVWLRASANSQQDNAVHVGLNGQALTTSDRMTFNNTTGAWQWTKNTMDGSQVATINIPSAGVYTLNVWMREDGMRLDRLLLTTSASFTPTGTGPAQSVIASNSTFSDSMMLPPGYESSRPEFSALFESDLLKSINVLAWNRTLRLFPASIQQRP